MVYNLALLCKCVCRGWEGGGQILILMSRAEMYNVFLLEGQSSTFDCDLCLQQQDTRWREAADALEAWCSQLPALPTLP